MPRLDNPQDPYSAPHAPKDKSGPVVRVAIMALLLAGAGLGWSYFASQPAQPIGVPQEEASVDQPIRVADAGSATTPEAATDATVNDNAAPAAAPARTAAPARRATPAPSAAPVTAPAPLSTPMESATPAIAPDPVAPPR